MIVCDNCRNETCSPHTLMLIQDKPKKNLKEIALDLCPKCVTTAMNNLEGLKKRGFLFKLPQASTNGVDNVMASIAAEATAAANASGVPDGH